MEVWGITGIIGSGKSTAIEILEAQGFPCIDADDVAKLVVDKNTELGHPGFESVYRAFGNGILDSQGGLDRVKLRKRIILNADDRATLEQIVHPLILAYINQRVSEWRDSGVSLGFVEGARLVESGFHRSLSGLLVITAEEKTIINRVVKRDSMGKDEVRAMVEVQDQNSMLREAKFQLPNDTSKKDLKVRLEKFIALRQK